LGSINQAQSVRFDYRLIGYFRTDVPNEDNLSIFDGYECIDGDQMKGQGAEDMVVTIENVALITSGLMWPVFQEKDRFYMEPYVRVTISRC